MTLPLCQGRRIVAGVCDQVGPHPAEYDAKTDWGHWAPLCQTAFTKLTPGLIGPGRAKVLRHNVRF